MKGDLYYPYNESFDKYEGGMAPARAIAFVRMKNQEKGGHYVVHTVAQYEAYMAKHIKGIAYVALVRPENGPHTPLKYKFKHFAMPTYTQLRAWGVDFNEAAGDTIQVWSIPHEVWNEMSEFTWARPK